MNLLRHLGECTGDARALHLDQGTSRAVDEFVRQSAAHLYRIAARVLSDPDDARDAVQAALTRTVTWVARHGLPRDLGAFVRTAVVHTALEMRRHRTRRARRTADGELLPDRPTACSEDPAHQTVARAELQRVLAAIERLPEKQRVAIKLFELEGMSVKEVAAAMCSRAGTVKVHLHRARGSLRRALEGDEPI